MRVGTMRRASLLTVGQRVGCSGAYSARLDPQTERAQVERGASQCIICMGMRMRRSAFDQLDLAS